MGSVWSPSSKKSIGGYHISEKILGKGYSCTVHKGVHSQSKQKVAIKIVDCDRPAIPASVFHEGELLRMLDHPGVISCHDIYREGSLLYLVLPHLRGGDLHDRILDDWKADYYDSDTRNHLLKQIAQTVCYIHEKGMVHRDIKPENILLREPVEDLKQAQLVLIDFGYASSSEEYLIDTPGTPAYASPEMYRQIPYRGEPSDVWALGMVFYFVAFRNLCFFDDDPIEMSYSILHSPLLVPGSCEPKFRKLLQAMLSKNPGTRPTIQEVVRYF